MEEYKRNVAVGVTTLAGLAGLLILMMMFGRLPLPGTSQQGWLLPVAMPSAGGLHPESRVNFAGIQVGRIESVEFRQGGKSGVLVTARIREGVEIPANVQAQAYSKPLGGSPTLELHVPRGAAAEQTLAKDNPRTVQGQVGGMPQQLGREIKSAIEGPMERFNELADQWTKVGRHVTTLVEPRDADAVDAGQSEANLVTVIERTDRRMREVGETLESIEKIVSDQKLQKDLEKTVANARAATKKLSERVDEVSANVNRHTEALKKRYVALADDLSSAVSSFEKLADQARQGEGTVGKLVNDPALYRNLNDAIERVNAAVDEAKLLLEKWKAEGVPVQF
jgi:phospholipid/cholesterol/gamma-HCH transport system substrate-binding protein